VEWGISAPVDFISFGLNPIYFLEWWNVYIKQGEEREGCSPLSCSTMNNQHREIGVCQVRCAGPAFVHSAFGTQNTCTVRFETLIAMPLKTKVLRVLLPRWLEKSDWRPKDVFCLHFQVQVAQEASSSHISNILNVINFLQSSGRIG
jgi:hypothetical protein